MAKNHFAPESVAVFNQNMQPDADYEPLKGVMWVYRRHWWDVDQEQREQLVELFRHAPRLQQAYLLRHQLTLIFDVNAGAKARLFAAGLSKI